MTFHTQPIIDTMNERDSLENEQTVKYKMRVSALQMIIRKRIKRSTVFVWPFLYVFFILFCSLNHVGMFGKPQNIMPAWMAAVLFVVVTWAVVWVAVRDAVTMAIHTAVGLEGRSTEDLFTVIGVEKRTPFTKGTVVIALKDPCGAVHHLVGKIDPGEAVGVKPGKDCDRLEQIHPFMANQLRAKWEPVLHSLEK